MSRDVLLVTTREGGTTGIQWVEVQDAAECLTMYRTAPTTEFSGPKCQKCQGCETWA